MKRRIVLLALILSGCAIILSTARSMKTQMSQKKEQAAFNALSEAVEKGVSAGSATMSPVYPIQQDGETDTTQANKEPENLERFADLIAKNNDFAAWITIEGTAVNYPVMFSPDEPDYYLHRSFEKEESLCGTPYIGKNCDIHSDNIIIYGHNMSNGTMFADLLLYRDEAFYSEHSAISFDSVECSAQYDILSVFREKVHYRDEVDAFRYYDYAGELTPEQYDEYVSKIKEISLYETGHTAAYGEQLITLSTCSYHTENGRFVVVAVRRPA